MQSRNSSWRLPASAHEVRGRRRLAGGHVENRIDTNMTTLLSDPGGERCLADAAERALVTRIANNDHLAMSRFALLYGARLTRFLRHLTWRRELVGEIINDTMLIVWQKAG